MSTAPPTEIWYLSTPAFTQLVEEWRTLGGPLVGVVGRALDEGIRSYLKNVPEQAMQGFGDVLARQQQLTALNILLRDHQELRMPLIKLCRVAPEFRAECTLRMFRLGWVLKDLREQGHRDHHPLVLKDLVSEIFVMRLDELVAWTQALQNRTSTPDEPAVQADRGYATRAHGGMRLRRAQG